jgi:DNA-binding CsgD family transcriptional regulator
MTRRTRGRPAHPDVLTAAEWSILDLWRHGLGRAAIAQRRGISEYGVRYHLRNITGKLGVGSTAELRHWPGFPVTSPRPRHRRHHPMNRLSLGPLWQVSMSDRDVLGLPEVFRFGDLVFFDCGGVRLYIHAV